MTRIQFYIDRMIRKGFPTSEHLSRGRIEDLSHVSIQGKTVLRGGSRCKGPEVGMSSEESGISRVHCVWSEGGRGRGEMKSEGWAGVKVGTERPTGMQGNRPAASPAAQQLRTL